MKRLSGVPLKGRLLALPTNIRLGWKGLAGTNALAYFGPWKPFQPCQLFARHCYKTFYVCNLGLVPVRFYGLVYCVEVRPEPISVEHLSSTPLFGRLVALSAYVKLGWKGLIGMTTLAYYEHS